MEIACEVTIGAEHTYHPSGRKRERPRRIPHAH